MRPFCGQSNEVLNSDRPGAVKLNGWMVPLIVCSLSRVSKERRDEGAADACRTSRCKDVSVTHSRFERELPDGGAMAKSENRSGTVEAWT